MRVEKFRRNGWAPPWPVGLEMLCYMLSHEAHHRGQVCMLAHLLGFPLPNEVAYGIWNWERLWKECGRRQRSEAGTRIPRVGGRCRNVARAITTHRLGLWAVDAPSGS